MPLTAAAAPVTLHLVTGLRREAGWLAGAALVLLGAAMSCQPSTGPAQSSTAPPPARLGAVLAADPAHHDLVFFGGKGPSAVEGDTWLWTGGRWSRRAPRPAPPARSFAAASADGRGGVLLYGGDPSDPTGTHDDTWRWDGSRWTELHPRTVPGVGAYRVMAQGPSGSPVLLVFGLDHQVTTWTWTGAARGGGDWVPAAIATAPPWRDASGLAMDPVSRRLILFGGVSAQGATAGDTWAWDGSTWSELRPAHRPAGGPAALTGAGTGPLLYEQDGTWTWTGADWTQQQPGGTPPWQAYSALAGVPGAGPGELLAILVTGPTPDVSQVWRWNGFGWGQV
jgi:hypothetical protein